jgi:hypothetical protein
LVALREISPIICAGKSLTAAGYSSAENTCESSMFESVRLMKKCGCAFCLANLKEMINFGCNFYLCEK